MKRFDSEKIIMYTWTVISFIVVLAILISLALIILGYDMIGEKTVLLSLLALEFQIIVGIVLFVSDLF